MQLQTTLAANEARSNFYQILDEVGDKLRQFTITLRGKTQAVIISHEEFLSWQETLEIMTNKKLRQNIKNGWKEIKTGRGIAEMKADKMIDW